MNDSRGIIWFNRFVLVVATFVMSMIALRNLRDPVGTNLPLGISLDSPSAVTVMRVGFGGFPLGFAAALFGCLLSARRLLAGMALLLAVVGAATVARVEGLIVDGATPYNVGLLRPEIAMVTLSVIGLVLERRRRNRVAALDGQRWAACRADRGQRTERIANASRPVMRNV